MPNVCVAAGCSNPPNKSKNWNEVVALFKFPDDPAQLEKWKSIITLTRPKSNLTSSSYLCSKHFDDECIANKMEYVTKINAGMKPPQ